MSTHRVTGDPTIPDPFWWSIEGLEDRNLYEGSRDLKNPIRDHKLIAQWVGGAWGVDEGGCEIEIYATPESPAMARMCIYTVVSYGAGKVRAVPQEHPE